MVGLSPDVTIHKFHKLEILEILIIGDKEFKKRSYNDIKELETHRRLKEVKFVKNSALDQDVKIYLVYRKINNNDLSKLYSDTLLLPKTNFPLRADAANREILFQDRCSKDLYKWQIENNPKEMFILHDGPPYADGTKKSALEALEIQRKEFISWGIMGDWENPYRTLDKEYEVRQLQVFHNMMKKGYIYRQNKPVHWSPSSRTALAEAELEYHDDHQSKSVYVKLSVINSTLNSQEGLKDNLYILIWTTTPWTLPANQAVAINPNIEYSIVCPNNDTLMTQNNYIIATKSEKQCKIIDASHITEESGTRLIHIAPGHGMEDYEASTPQWFANVEAIKQQAIKLLEDVKMVPKSARYRSLYHEGVPIPVFYESETDVPLLTDSSVEHIIEIFKKHGSDGWWKLDDQELLAPEYKNNGKTYRKGNDTMDVWFDSGVSWTFILEQTKKKDFKAIADLYLEGSDQHRGWFQFSLLTSVAVNDKAPYSTLITHGFVMGEQDQKMSKSLGNVINPSTIIKGGKVSIISNIL
ncbi:Nucleotidylyl transferase [Rhizophagus irregularis]|nr:Nucleotidylyl transferase [Rhizophagus irregularis]